MLVVVVDDLHQACKQHISVVGRRRSGGMGKSVIGQVLARSCLCSGTGMEAGGDFHHHQPEEGHGDQQGAGMGHGASPGSAQTLKQI